MTEIAPAIYSMGQLKGAFVHAFLLEHAGQLVLIDTLYDNDAHRVLREIKRAGREVTDLKHIILTHAHRSHLGGLARLKELSGATVYAHAWEADIIAGQRRAQCVTWRPGEPFAVWPLQVALNLGVAKHPPCPVDETLDDGDEVGPLQVLHTPGHSPGHLAFYWPDRRALFAGDAIVTWPRLTAGWPGFTLNPVQQRASVQRMAELDVDVLGSGHGDPIAAGAGDRLRALVG